MDPTGDQEPQKPESFNEHLKALPVPFTPIKNPYRTGLPIVNSPMFIGRQELIEDLAREMTRGDRTSAVIIYGQKRSGKTSILRNLETFLADYKNESLEQVISVYFSMQTVFMEEGLIVPGILYLIADKIADTCKQLGLGGLVGSPTPEEILSSSDPLNSFHLFLSNVYQRSGIRVVLLIDEFTELVFQIECGRIDQSFMRYLRSLVDQGFVSCIFCGIDTMPRMLKRYSNELAVTDSRIVGYLEYSAAAELIERPISLPDGKSRYTSPQVIDKIIRLTAGSPYFIQYFCFHLVNYLNLIRSATIAEADIDWVVSDLIQGPKAPQMDNMFDCLWRYKGDETLDTRETTIEGLFLYLLADETRTRQFAQFAAIRQRASFIDEIDLLNIAEELEVRQVIERASGPIHRYKIIVDLFRRWINVKRPMDSETLNRFRRKLQRTVS